MIGKIFMIMGKSGSGKDFIKNEVLKRNIPFLYQAVPMTTRPKRPNEEDGKDYIFITDEEFHEMVQKDQDVFVDCRSYDILTKNNLRDTWRYFYTIDSFDISSPNIKNYIMISTLDGYQNFISYDNYGISFKDKIVPIYIEVEDHDLLLRSIKRETENDNPNYLQVCNRFINDYKDFKIIPENFIRIQNKQHQWRETVKQIYLIIYQNIFDVVDDREEFKKIAVKGLYKYLYDFIVSSRSSTEVNNEVYRILEIQPDCNPYISDVVSNAPYTSTTLLLREYRISGHLICNDEIDRDRPSVFDLIFYRINSDSDIYYAVIISDSIMTIDNVLMALAYNGKSFTEIFFYYDKQFKRYEMMNQPSSSVVGFGTNDFNETASYFQLDLNKDKTRKVAQNMLKKLHSIIIIPN